MYRARLYVRYEVLNNNNTNATMNCLPVTTYYVALLYVYWADLISRERKWRWVFFYLWRHFRSTDPLQSHGPNTSLQVPMLLHYIGCFTMCCHYFLYSIQIKCINRNLRFNSSTGRFGNLNNLKTKTGNFKSHLTDFGV